MRRKREKIPLGNQQKIKFFVNMLLGIYLFWYTHPSQLKGFKKWIPIYCIHQYINTSYYYTYNMALNITIKSRPEILNKYFFLN